MNYPIVILWSHPRSMSTAIERIMRERGDFECLHEPFLQYYYSKRSDRELAHFSSQCGHPSSYVEIRDLVLEKATTSPVFVKDMSYYVMPELFDHGDFCRRIVHCFLIRNPLSAIPSFYRLDPEFTRYEVGLEAQWQHYNRLLDAGIPPGPVLEAELVQADPAEMMRRFWRMLGLDYREQALTWEPDAAPDDWKYVEGWHRGVSSSNGIRPPGEDRDRRAAQAFEKICREAPHLQDYLDHHLPFYHHLQRVGLKPRTHTMEM